MCLGFCCDTPSQQMGSNINWQPSNGFVQNQPIDPGFHGGLGSTIITQSSYGYGGGGGFVQEQQIQPNYGMDGGMGTIITSTPSYGMDGGMGSTITTNPSYGMDGMGTTHNNQMGQSTWNQNSY